jgi:hypothetical protein
MSFPTLVYLINPLRIKENENVFLSKSEQKQEGQLRSMIIIIIIELKPSYIKERGRLPKVG